MKKSKPASLRTPNKIKRAASPMSKTQKAKAPAKAKAGKTAKTRAKGKGSSAGDSAGDFADTGKVISFELPDIAEWPTMEQAFGMQPDQIKLLVDLKPMDPLLMKETGLVVPESVRAAYNLAINFAFIQNRHKTEFEQMIMQREAYDVAVMGMPRGLDDHELGEWDAKIQKAYTALLTLTALSDANATKMMARLYETLKNRGIASLFTVVDGYRIVQFNLAPTLQWSSVITKEHRPFVAYFLVTNNIDPCDMPDGLLEQILEHIQNLEAEARAQQPPAKRARPSKRVQKSRPRKELPKIKKRGPKRPSVPASPSATASSRPGNSVGTVIGFAFDPNAATGKKPKSPF